MADLASGIKHFKQGIKDEDSQVAAEPESESSIAGKIKDN